MATTLTATVPDTLKQAARGARSFVRDVRSDLHDSVERGRHLARKGKRALSRASSDVERYADDHTALVALGALGLGVALGVLVRRRR